MGWTKLMGWKKLSEQSDDGWYVVRYSWDTHPHNNGVCQRKGHWLRYKRGVKNLIGVGPYPTEQAARDAADRPAWENQYLKWPSLTPTQPH